MATVLKYLIFIQIFFSEVANSGSWLEEAKKLPLPPEQWVEVKAYKLKRARLVWINRNYFAQLGVNVPNPITPEFEALVLNAFAYGVPSPQDPKEAFDKKKEVVGGSDRYGGWGLSSNSGSGRALTYSAKLPGQTTPFIIQSKGVGRTPLVWEHAKADHANGVAHMDEAIKEAIYAQINTADLPLRSNQVIALIDRGTESTNSHGETMIDSLIIREFSVRPAHFMLLSGIESQPEETLKYLLINLPGKGNNLISRLGLYAENIAHQFAIAYARRLYHGGPSPSNIELSGRWLDFGTESAHPGYGKMKIMNYSFVDPVGEFDGIKNSLITDFLEELSQRLEGEFHISPKDKEKIERRFNRQLQTSLAIGFIELTGIPTHIAEELAKTTEGKNFSSLLIKLATEDAAEYIGKHKIPDQVSKYDINSLLTKLAQNPLITPKDMQPVVAQYLTDTEVQKFITAYQTVIGFGVAFAKDKDFLNNLKERAEQINKDLSVIYRANIFKPAAEVTKKYQTTHNPQYIQNEIDRIVSTAIRNDASINRRYIVCPKLL